MSSLSPPSLSPSLPPSNLPATSSHPDATSHIPSLSKATLTPASNLNLFATPFRFAGASSSHPSVELPTWLQYNPSSSLSSNPSNCQCLARARSLRLHAPNRSLPSWHPLPPNQLRNPDTRPVRRSDPQPDADGWQQVMRKMKRHSWAHMV
jgi:hypothetical protein